MKIEEAIETLETDLRAKGGVAITPLNQAHALGLEALKRVYNIRLRHPPLPFVPLPGETKEEKEAK